MRQHFILWISYVQYQGSTPHSNQNLYYIFVHEYFRMYMQRKFQIVFTDDERPRNVQIRILLIISVYHLNIIIHIHTEISWKDALLTA